MATVRPPVPLGRAVDTPVLPRSALFEPTLSRSTSPVPPLPPSGSTSPVPPPPLPPSPPIIPPVITVDDFEDLSGYGMKYSAFTKISPHLKGLSKKEDSKPEKEKKEKDEENKPVDRFSSISDTAFKEKVKEFTEKFKGKEGAGKKRDAVEKAAKEFWNDHLGERINYKDLKEELEAVVPT